jgi:hypothetical protein
LYDDFEERRPGAARALATQLECDKFVLRNTWGSSDWDLTFWHLIIIVLYLIFAFLSLVPPTSPAEIPIYGSWKHLRDDHWTFIFGPSWKSVLASTLPFIFATVAWNPLPGTRNFSSMILKLELLKRMWTNSLLFCLPVWAGAYYMWHWKFLDCIIFFWALAASLLISFKFLSDSIVIASPQESRPTLGETAPSQTGTETSSGVYYGGSQPDVPAQGSSHQPGLTNRRLAATSIEQESGLPLFLLTCMSRGTYAVNLLQLDLRHTLSDSQLFRALKAQYTAG